jgi:hypothetical protein
VNVLDCGTVLVLPAGTFSSEGRGCCWSGFHHSTTLKKSNAGLLGEEAPPICAFNLSGLPLCGLRNKAYNTVIPYYRLGVYMKRQGGRVADLVTGLSHRLRVTYGRPVDELQ